MITRLSLVTILVRDQEKALRWFTEILGLKKLQDASRCPDLLKLLVVRSSGGSCWSRGVCAQGRRSSAPDKNSVTNRFDNVAPKARATWINGRLLAKVIRLQSLYLRLMEFGPACGSIGANEALSRHKNVILIAMNGDKSRTKSE